MHLHNTRLARHLWALVLGLMLAMLALGASVAAYTERVQAMHHHQLELVDKRLMLAMRWKSLGEVSVERVVVGALSAESVVVQHMRDLSKAAIVQISETQQLLTEMAQTPAERRLLEDISIARKATLHWVEEVQDARQRGDMGVSLVLVQQQLRPTAQRYFQIQDGLMDLYAQMRQDIRAQAVQQRNRVLWMAAGVATCLLLVTFWLTLWLSRRVQQAGHAKPARLALALGAGSGGISNADVSKQGTAPHTLRRQALEHGDAAARNARSPEAGGETQARVLPMWHHIAVSGVVWAAVWLWSRWS